MQFIRAVSVPGSDLMCANVGALRANVCDVRLARGAPEMQSLLGCKGVWVVQGAEGLGGNFPSSLGTCRVHVLSGEPPRPASCYKWKRSS